MSLFVALSFLLLLLPSAWLICVSLAFPTVRHLLPRGSSRSRSRVGWIVSRTSFRTLPAPALGFAFAELSFISFSSFPSDSVGDEKADTVNITIPVDDKGQLNQMEATDGGKAIRSVKMPQTTEEAKQIVEK